MAAAFSYIDDGTTEHRSRGARSRRLSSSTRNPLPGVANQSKYENYNVEIDDGLGWADPPQADTPSLSSVSTHMSTVITVVDMSSTVEVPISPALAHYRVKGLTDIKRPPGAPEPTQFVIRGKHGEKVTIPLPTKDDTMLDSSEKPKTKTAKLYEKTQHQNLDPVTLSAATKWQDELWLSRQSPSPYSLHKHKRSSAGSKLDASKLEGDEAKSAQSSDFSLKRHAFGQHADGKKSRSSTFSLGKDAMHRLSSDAKGHQPIPDTSGRHSSSIDKKHATQSSNSSSTFSITKHAFHQAAEDHNHHKYFSVKRPSTVSKHPTSFNHWQSQIHASKVPSSIVWFAGGPLQLPTSRSISTTSDTRQLSTHNGPKRRIYTVSRASHNNQRSKSSKPSSPPIPKSAHDSDVCLEKDWAQSQHEWEQAARSATIDQDLARSEHGQLKMPDLGRSVNDHDSMRISQIRPDLFYKDWPPMQYQEELDHAKDVARLEKSRKMGLKPKLSVISKSTAGKTAGRTSKRPNTSSESIEQLNLRIAQRPEAPSGQALHDLEATPEDLRILANYLTSVRPDIQDEWKAGSNGTATDLLYIDPSYRQRLAAREAKIRKRCRAEHGLDTASMKTVQPGDSASQLSTVMAYTPKSSKARTDASRNPTSERKSKQYYTETMRSYRAPTVENHDFDQRSELRTSKRNVVVSYRRGQIEPIDAEDESANVGPLDHDERAEWIRRTIDRAPKAVIRTLAALPRVEAEVDSLNSSSRRTRSSSRRSTPLRNPSLPEVEAENSKKEVVARWDVVEVFKQISSSDTCTKPASRASKSQRGKQSLCDVVEVFEEASNRSQAPSDRHIATEGPKKSRTDSAGRGTTDESWYVVEVLAPGERSTASREDRNESAGRTWHEVEAEQNYAWRERTEKGSKERSTTSWGPVESISQHAAGNARSHVASKKSSQSRASHATQRTETPSRKVVGWDDGLDREASLYDHKTPKRGWKGSGSGLSQDSKAVTQAPSKKVIGWDDGVVGPARVVE